MFSLPFHIHHMSIPLALTLILIITLDVTLPPPYGSLCPKVNKYPKPTPITLLKKNNHWGRLVVQWLGLCAFTAEDPIPG